MKFKNLNIFADDNRSKFLFKQCKVVPLYGDMQIAPFNYVMRTKNYEASKWPACNSQSEGIQGKILEQAYRIRNEHTSYISELAKYSNEVNFKIKKIRQIQFKLNFKSYLN